jgi:cytochrome c
MKASFVLPGLFCLCFTGALGLRAGDLEKGRQIFASCGVCHAVTAENKTGPGLLRIVGRKAGTGPGFRYSRAMKRAKIVWDANTLDAYLADPQGTVPGNTMPFPGLPNDRQRKDLVAYLQTLR